MSGQCVYESDCHGIEMIKSPSGKEWAIGGTNTKDRWKFCPWCGCNIRTKQEYKYPFTKDWYAKMDRVEKIFKEMCRNIEVSIPYYITDTKRITKLEEDIMNYATSLDQFMADNDFLTKKLEQIKQIL